MVLLVLLAQAADPVRVGGGLSAGVALTIEEGDPPVTGGGTAAEADLAVDTGGLLLRLDLDLRYALAQGPVHALSLAPENAWVGVRGGDVALATGVMVAPWRTESVDGWDRGLVTESPVSDVGLGGPLAGGALAWRSEAGGLLVVGAVDLGKGVSLLEPLGGQLAGAPAVAGARGELAHGGLTLGAGGAWRPARHDGMLEVDGRLELASLLAEGQVVLGVASPSGGRVGVEVLPGALCSPAARIDGYAGRLGGALGVTARPAPFVRVAVEAAWYEDRPQVALAVDGYTPTTSRRSGVGGDVRDLAR